MLSKDEYDLAMSSMIDGALFALLKGYEDVAFGVLQSAFASTWDLTRPDVHMQIVDITPRLGEIDKAVDYVEGVKVHAVWDGEGNPLMGFGLGRTHEGGDIRETDVPSDIMAAISSMIEETVRSLGLDPDDDRLVNLDQMIHAKTEKVIDDEVAEFSTELDSIFETWKGGD